MTRLTAVASLVVVVIVIVLASCGGPNGPPVGVAGPPVVVDCVAPPGAQPAPTPAAGELVAIGAVAARLCTTPALEPRPVPTPIGGGPATSSPEVPDGGPTLVHDVDRLVHTLNGFPSEPQVCTSDIPEHRTLVLTYPGGGRAELTVDVRTCRSVQRGDVTRYGPVAGVLQDLLEQQRVAGAAGGTPVAPECAASRRGGPVGLIELRDDALTRHARVPVPYEPGLAVVCRYTNSAGQLRLLDSGIIDDRLPELRALVNDAVPAGDLYTEAPPECPGDAATIDVLLFLDRAGGGYEVLVRDEGCRRIYTNPQAPLRFAAPAELIERLDAAIG